MSRLSDGATLPAPSTGTRESMTRVAPVYLIPLLAATERAGFTGDALFHGLGLVAGDLAVPGFTVTSSEANTVVRRALHLLRAPDLGLTLGMNTRITERGAMALGLMAAATLGDAIALTLKFPASAGYLLSVHAEFGKKLHTLIAEPLLANDDIAPFLVDIMFAGSVRMRRHVTESHYAPARIDLVRQRPDNAAAYEKQFACPVRFGCERNELVSELRWLDCPLPMANAMAYRLSRQWLEREFARSDTASELGLAVERAIRRALPSTVSPADLAKSLSMSERGLRRKLVQEGLGFRNLLDKVRKARALQLTLGATSSLLDIAVQTGFSDTRAFSRAFKRWTGESPSTFRASTQPPSG